VWGIVPDAEHQSKYENQQELWRIQIMSLAELSQIWKPYTHAQWIRRRQRKKEFIDNLRHNMPPAQLKAWNIIRYAINFKHLGYWFCREQECYGYSIDFYCHQLKLGIEIDGPKHKTTEKADKYREQNLAKYGIELVRFTNHEVYNQSDYVYRTIIKACEDRIKEFQNLY